MSSAKKLAETIQCIKDKEEWKEERINLLKRISELHIELENYKTDKWVGQYISGPCPPPETKRDKRLKFIKKAVDSSLKVYGFFAIVYLYFYSISLWASM